MKVKNLASNNIRKTIADIGIRLSKEAAEYGAGEARRLYDEAEYDGRVDNIVIEVKQTKTGSTLTAQGPQVEAIEYGADGSQGTKVLYSRKTGEPFWFFKAETDHFNAGGGMKRETKKVVTPYARKTVTVNGKKKMAPMTKADLEKIQKTRYKNKISLQEVFKREIQENGPIYRTAEKYREEYGGFTMERRYAEKTAQASGKLSKKYGYTFGNEPQHVMEETKKLILEYIQKKNA